jgi:putative endonuclease
MRVRPLTAALVGPSLVAGDEEVVAVRAQDAVGRYGERVAAQHLRGAGWEVLDLNWRCRWGELDLVARDGDCVVAVEVKTRRSTIAGHPLEAVTPAKVARLRRLLSQWMSVHEGVHSRDLRVDVVAVLRPPRGPAVVEHLRGVF